MTESSEKLIHDKQTMFLIVAATEHSTLHMCKHRTQFVSSCEMFVYPGYINLLTQHLYNLYQGLWTSQIYMNEYLWCLTSPLLLLRSDWESQEEWSVSGRALLRISAKFGPPSVPPSRESSETLLLIILLFCVCQYCSNEYNWELVLTLWNIESWDETSVILGQTVIFISKD